jgi:hypothetical protein
VSSFRSAPAPSEIQREGERERKREECFSVCKMQIEVVQNCRDSFLGVPLKAKAWREEKKCVR